MTDPEQTHRELLNALIDGGSLARELSKAEVIQGNAEAVGFLTELSQSIVHAQIRLRELLPVGYFPSISEQRRLLHEAVANSRNSERA